MGESHGYYTVYDGSGYLEALNNPSVTPVWDDLAGMTTDSAITSDGELLSPSDRSGLTREGRTFKLDYLALATGFDLVRRRTRITSRMS